MRSRPRANVISALSASGCKVVDATMISTGDRQMLQQFKQEGKPIAYLPNMVDASIETGTAFNDAALPTTIFCFCANTGRRQFCGKDKEVEQIIDESAARIPGIKWLLGGLKDQPACNGATYLDAFKQGPGSALISAAIMTFISTVPTVWLRIITATDSWQ